MTPTETTTQQNNPQTERIARLNLLASLFNIGASIIRFFTRFWP